MGRWLDVGRPWAILKRTKSLP
ncbi:hypothetical protein CCACVL1_26938 [Corchorus capsularis]|uniref:Uncharacterized protein n=1 Tax=Corchorus capsularis TaxID=210143 RepID=A0A1R3GCT8_COCAP|nr:hypothetical protein CCACVL1_26938 [Corchorus capsularis]